MIPVKVDQLLISNVGFVVLLKGLHDERSLPIFIGATEAQAIALWTNKVEVPRPLTHDLLKSILDYMECRLVRVEICDLREGTFYASLILDTGGEERAMDSRPSDAINLALRLEAPIYVSAEVMNEAGRVLPEELSTAGGDAVEAPDGVRGAAAGENDLSGLQRQLEQAVVEERYEAAASLRDAIKRYREAHGAN